MNEVMELAFEDDALRQLLKFPALRQIGLVRQNPRLWLNTPKPLRTKFEKSILALADVNADIKYLVQAFVASKPKEQARLRTLVSQYLLYVLRLANDAT